MDQAFTAPARPEIPVAVDERRDADAEQPLTPSGTCPPGAATVKPPRDGTVKLPAENVTAPKQADGVVNPPDGGIVNDASAALAKLQTEALQSLRKYCDLVVPAAQHVERSLMPPIAPPEKKTDVDWLFVIDITTKDFGRGDNLARRLGQLKDAAAESKDKNVAIVLQLAVQDVPERNTSQEEFYKFFVPTPYHIDRYVIHDGKMEKLATVNSSGYAGDVKTLLSCASSRFEGAKTALLIDSHGMGNSGLSGDIGRTSTPDFAKAVREGWKGSKKIDLIDFDTCLMAQNGVLRELGHLTDHVVASAETEGGLGQDLSKTVKALLANPKMTPDELGELMVETARLQPLPIEPKPPHKPENLAEWIELLTTKKVEGPPAVQVRTLAHFDMAHYDKFSSKLDAFGDALTEAIKDPKNRRALDEMIGTVADYGGLWDMPGELKDLKAFTDKLFDAITDGKIADADGQLRIHGGRVLDAHKKLVESYSGFGKHTARGGLSVYLPERDFLDFHMRAEHSFYVWDLRSTARDVELLGKDKDAFTKQLDKRLKSVHEEIEKEKDKAEAKDLADARKSLAEAQAAADALKNATDLKPTLAALADLARTTDALLYGRLYQDKIVEKERKTKQEIDEAYKAQLIDAKTGWGRFRQALRHLD